MKVIVNRQLAGALYHVSFKVSDFTPDELQKMQSFGVPIIDIAVGFPGRVGRSKVPVTGIAENMKIAFSTEQDARAYEETVLGQIREAMKSLRERKDDFTSSAEVNI
jgi:hypothetical protein